MFCAILKATNSSFQKGMTFCRNVYVKKVIKLLAFIFEQPSYKADVIIDNKPLLDPSILTKRRFWLVCVIAQAHMSLRCLTMWYVPNSHVLAPFGKVRHDSRIESWLGCM